MLPAPSIITSRKSIIVPDRAPYTGHRLPGKRRNWNPLRASFIDGANVQHRARNILLSGDSAPPVPDPFYANVYYLFDGSLDGGLAVDRSPYNGRFNLNGLQGAQALAPFAGTLSLRRQAPIGFDGMLVVSGSVPPGTLTDTRTWSVECWVRVQAGCVARLYMGYYTHSGGGSLNVTLQEDVFPVVMRARAFDTVDCNPGTTFQIANPPAPPGSDYPYYDIWVFYGAYCNSGVLTQTINGVNVAQFVGPAGPAIRGFGNLNGVVGGEDLTGSIAGRGINFSQLRLTSGICRQTVYPFAVPTAPFPTFGP